MPLKTVLIGWPIGQQWLEGVAQADDAIDLAIAVDRPVDGAISGQVIGDAIVYPGGQQRANGSLTFGGN